VIKLDPTFAKEISLDKTLPRKKRNGAQTEYDSIGVPKDAEGAIWGRNASYVVTTLKRLQDSTR
jgi:hypothetical protein